MNILTFPKDALLLRRKARAIRDDEFGTEPLIEFADELGRTMLENKGAGLASTQVAEAPGGEPWRMFALLVSDGNFGIVCNPEILAASREEMGPEGCLSFSSVLEPIRSFSRVVMRFRNTSGVEHTETFEDMYARCVFHEEKHLSGFLLIDRMGTLQRSMFMKRVGLARRAK